MSEQQSTPASPAQSANLNTLVKKLFSICQGRSTSFFIAFFISGTVFHALHRLDQTYISFMLGLLGFVVGHSAKEDYFAKKAPAS